MRLSQPFGAYRPAHSVNAEDLTIELVRVELGVNPHERIEWQGRRHITRAQRFSSDASRCHVRQKRRVHQVEDAGVREEKRYDG